MTWDIHLTPQGQPPPAPRRGIIACRLQGCEVYMDAAAPSPGFCSTHCLLVRLCNLILLFRNSRPLIKNRCSDVFLSHLLLLCLPSQMCTRGSHGLLPFLQAHFDPLQRPSCQAGPQGLETLLSPLLFAPSPNLPYLKLSQTLPLP